MNENIIRDYELGESMVVLSKKYQIHHKRIKKILVESGVQIRSISEATVFARGRVYLRTQAPDIAAKYLSGHSLTTIAKEYGTSHGTIRRVLVEWGVNIRGRNDGPTHPGWKGGTRTLNGYKMVVLPTNDEQFRSMCITNKNYVMEHRLVVARNIGRSLETHETVHHINGDRLDNRIENLQLRSSNHGAGQVSYCGDCGSHNILFKEM